MAASSSSSSSQASPRPSTLQVWVTAARPHTLTASLAPCIVAYAANRPAFWPIQLIWSLFCLSIQIGTNLHNDYSDFWQGADDPKLRVGQARATAQGWISPETTIRAAMGTLSVTFLCGLALMRVANNSWSDLTLWMIVLSSIFCAIAYTGGPYPLGWLLGQWSIAYAGLGEIFVMLYFGYAATLTIPYAMSLQQQHQLSIDWTRQVMYATQVGLLATNIIIVNNLRDRHSDSRVRKLTTSVRFGRAFSLIEYQVCMLTSYVLVLVEFIRYTQSLASLLPLLSFPLAVREAKAVAYREGAALNQHVGGAAKIQLLFCLLLSLGIVLSK
jgi:1,4-dihydroxy-2-naphthoate octaprenyltransferase